MRHFSGNGDYGTSSLIDGKPISKGDMIFEVIGTLDEASAFLGLAVSLCQNSDLKLHLVKLQDYLSKIMGILASPIDGGDRTESFLFDATEWLENAIETYGGYIDKPQAFIHSGETGSGAAIDIARTVVRRAERTSVRYCDLIKSYEKEILVFLNRLSSLLFILRLYADISRE